jgi:hypothetical protein
MNSRPSLRKGQVGALEVKADTVTVVQVLRDHGRASTREIIRRSDDHLVCLAEFADCKRSIGKGS